MITSNSNAVQMTNREFFRQRETTALFRIPGVRELMNANSDHRSVLEQEYPDAAFALNIISNPFIADRELGAIQMEAYSSILNGDAISDVHFKYNRQVDAYMTRHNWD